MFKRIIPIRQLIHPEKIAGATCEIMANSGVSGELWCDAGWVRRCERGSASDKQ